MPPTLSQLLKAMVDNGAGAVPHAGDGGSIARLMSKYSAGSMIEPERLAPRFEA